MLRADNTASVAQTYADGKLTTFSTSTQKLPASFVYALLFLSTDGHWRAQWETNGTYGL